MVLCSGCFDGLHAGHVAYVEAAKALCEDGEVLVCAVAPDGYIEAAKDRTQFWTQAERLVTVRALRDVDVALAQRDHSVASLIRQHHPRLFVKGPDWRQGLPTDVVQACDECGTQIVFVETDGLHTSQAMGVVRCPTT